MIRRLERLWSPEQIAGRFRREGRLQISHETIYCYSWADKRRGGTLYTHLRGSQKQRRKRYGAYDSRGRLAGKRPISTRPHAAEARTRIGHWEADTVLGAGQAGPCIFTMVERKTGYVAIGQLPIRRSTAVNARAAQLIRAQPRPVHTITADNALHPVSSGRGEHAEAGAVVAHRFQPSDRAASPGPTSPAVFHVARIPC